MIAVVTPDEMAAVDRAAPEPVEALVDRAGRAVAGAALDLLGGAAYGKRIVVVAGKGNNGADGRVAASVLRRRGAAVRVVEPGSAAMPPADLVIDAAYGTGLRGRYDAPDPAGAPVLAVDIPSGLSGLTGEAVEGGHAVRAAATVTFAALKPGLLLGDGPSCSGRIELADIGLGRLAAAGANAWLVTDDDVAAHVPDRPYDAHKWQSAVALVAGSPGMTGAAWLAGRAALRAGAGYVRLGVPGAEPAATGLPPGEMVVVALPETGWDAAALDGVARCRSLVVGPGLGRANTGGTGPASSVGRLLAGATVPAVVDADGLWALGDLDGLGAVARSRRAATIVTPHAGEFAGLTGAPPGPDRLADVRAAAARGGSIVLLKGSTTVVAHPDGRVLLVASGSSRLATAGTGDVLSGVIGALLARGVPAFEAAALGAHIHGRAAGLGPPVGLVASDLPDLVSRWLSGASSAGRPPDVATGPIRRVVRS